MESVNQIISLTSSSSEVFEYNYAWKIPNFNITKVYGETLKLKDIHCKIMLVPFSEPNRYSSKFIRSYFTVFFTKVPDNNKNVWFNFNVQTARKRHPVFTSTFQKVEMSIEGFRGIRNNLCSVGLPHMLTKNKNLELDIKFMLDEFTYTSFNMANLENERSQLSEDFGKLLMEPKFADMKLICANNEEVPANKALIAARSAVFAKILSKDVDTYVIGDFGKEAVTEFLRFIYADTVLLEKFDGNTIELLKMAKKYKVIELAKICQQDLKFGCKEKMNEIFNRFNKQSWENIADLNNYDEICSCINNLYRATMKNRKLN